jgi:hypothetical protein
LQWPGVLPHQSDEGDSDERANTKNKIDELILPCAVHHPSGAILSAKYNGGDAFTYPANNDPIDMEVLFGSKCKPIYGHHRY